MLEGGGRACLGGAGLVRALCSRSSALCAVVCVSAVTVRGTDRARERKRDGGVRLLIWGEEGREAGGEG